MQSGLLSGLRTKKMTIRIKQKAVKSTTFLCGKDHRSVVYTGHLSLVDLRARHGIKAACRMVGQTVFRTCVDNHYRSGMYCFTVRYTLK